MTRTLLLIFAFIAFMIGSFIWFVATWDASKEEPVSLITDESSDFRPFGPNKLPPQSRSATYAVPEIQPNAFQTLSIRKPYGVS